MIKDLGIMEEYEQEVVWRVYTARQSTVCEREDIIIGKGEYEKEGLGIYKYRGVMREK